MPAIIHDNGRSNGTPVAPPAVAGFPGLAGLLLISPIQGKGKGANATAADHAEWVSYDYYINLDTVLKSVFGALLLFRLLLQFVRHLRTISCLELEKQSYYRRPNVLWGHFKRHVLYAPVWGQRYAKEVQLRRRATAHRTVSRRPTRAQALWMAAYVGVNVTFCVLGIEWHAERVTMLQQLSNRTGILALENMIVMFLFIMRANPVAWILNISFDSIQFMHVWFAHIVVAQTLCHASAWVAARIISGGFKKFSDNCRLQYIYTAIMGLAALMVVHLSSFSPIRHAFYRIFAHLHVLFTFFTIVGIYVHLKHFPHLTLVIAVILLWSLERGLRILSILWRNVGKGGTYALVELTADDTMRLTLNVARPWKFQAGQHIHLYIPSVGWKSHPFAVAWQANANIQREENTEVGNAPSTKTTPVILIRRREGFTSKLFERLVRERSSRLLLKAFVEGPYHESKSFNSYGTILLIAGSNGISAQISRATDMIEQVKEGLAVARRISLVWCIQKPEHMQWVVPWMEIVDRFKVPRGLFEVRIYVTREELREHMVLSHLRRIFDRESLSEADDDFERAGQRKSAFTIEKMCNMKEEMEASRIGGIFYHKPRMRDIIDEEVAEQNGAMIVSVCGPPSMSNDVRTAVRRLQTTSNMDFLEESFYS